MTEVEHVNAHESVISGEAEAAFAVAALLDFSRKLDRNSGRAFGEPRDASSPSEVARRLALRLRGGLSDRYWAMQPSDAAAEIYAQETATKEAPLVS